MRIGKGIRHFREHPLCSHDFALGSVHPRHHARMMLIPSVDQRYIEKRIGENSHGFFAWP